MNIAWVHLGDIPPVKTNEGSVAYVGSLVGVTLEIDLSTLTHHESVRDMIGCRDVDGIPPIAEGVLDKHFHCLV